MFINSPIAPTSYPELRTRKSIAYKALAIGFFVAMLAGIITGTFAMIERGDEERMKAYMAGQARNVVYEKRVAKIRVEALATFSTPLQTSAFNAYVQCLKTAPRGRPWRYPHHAHATCTEQAKLSIDAEDQSQWAAFEPRLERYKEAFDNTYFERSTQRP